MDTGRSLELYFINGRPDGMLTAALFNWTGHVLKAPRTLIKQALNRDEASQTGVYLLLGATEAGPLAYIGETEDMAGRLKQHVATKDWWETAFLIGSTAGNLHKAHVKYLESRLHEMASRIGKLPLENANTPPRPHLNEAARANMEGFLDNLLMILPTLGVDMFVDKRRETAPAPAPAAPVVVFVLHQAKGGIDATANLQEGEIVVQKGSTLRHDWTGKPGFTEGYKALRAQLTTNGILAEGADGRLRFTQNYAFSSPGAAAAVILGRAANGRIEWNLKDSTKTYADWEAAQVKDIA